MDRFDQYAGQPTLADFYGDVSAIPVHDSSLDYVATSHVIEHSANPVQAIIEWVRALRNGGHIYMVVPHRQLTFDRPRALTTIEHLLEDHRNGTTQVDATHIDEFVFNIDWRRFSPASDPASEQTERIDLARNYHERVSRGEEINIHFHTFEPERTVELFSRINALLPAGTSIKVVEQVSPFSRSRPDGSLIVARVAKVNDPHAFRGERTRSSVLRTDARPMVR